MYSGEYDVCDVTLSVYPHRASLKNMPRRGGNRTYDLWDTSPLIHQLRYRPSPQILQHQAYQLLYSHGQHQLTAE